jgi:hypothetical protein
VAGDYAAAGIRALAFRTAGDGHTPRGAVAVLTSRRGRTWRNANVSVAAEAGVWTLNLLPLTLAGGWDRAEPAGTDKAALWASDLRDVASVGVRFAAGGTAAQSYSVDDLMLVGDGFLTPLQQALLAHFGVLESDAVDPAAGAADADEDGMSDLDEVLAGTDSADATDTFRVELVAVDAAGVGLRWRCRAEGGRYVVDRAISADGAFTPVQPAGINGPVEQIAGRAYMNYTDRTAPRDHACFYRVTLQMEE